MTVIDTYLESQTGTTQDLLGHMYDLVRTILPDAQEALSYAMPTFIVDGHAIVAIIANKRFLSLYPFCNVARLELDLSNYECTKGSIHFTVDHPIPDQLLRAIVAARLALIQ